MTLRPPSLGAAFTARDNNFNLIRLVAALLVIYGHASAITGHGPVDFWQTYVGYRYIGAVSVDVFFVASGFLVTASALSGKGLRFFIASRALRIYPALVACTALTVLVLGPLLTESGHYWSADTWRYAWINATAKSTVFFLPGVFEQNFDHAVNGSIWSLAVEVRLYVLVLACAALTLLRRRALFTAFTLVMLLAAWTRPTLYDRLMMTELSVHAATMFAIGALMWVHRDRIPLSPWIALALLAAGVAAHGTQAIGLVYHFALPYCVFVLAFIPGFAWFNRFGDYSYGTYLYGWPAQQLALVAMGQAASNAMNTLAGSALALVLALVSWHVIEKPALRFKRHFLPKERALAAAAGPGAPEGQSA